MTREGPSSLDDRIVRLRRKGHTYREIIAALGASQTLVCEALRDAGLVREDKRTDPRAPYGGDLGVVLQRCRRHRSTTDPADKASWSWAAFCDAAEDRISLLKRAGVHVWIDPEDAAQEAMLAWLEHPDVVPMHYVAIAKHVDSSVAACSLGYEVGRKVGLCAAGLPAPAETTGANLRTPPDLVARLFTTRPEWRDCPVEDDTHERLEAREEVARLLSDLPPRQRFVVAARYGIIDGAPRTLDEIAEALDVSRERARQLEADAMDKLSRRSDARHKAAPEGGWETSLPTDFGRVALEHRNSASAEERKSWADRGRKGAAMARTTRRAAAKKRPAKVS